MEQKQIEEILIKRFIINHKQDRYLGFINKERTRFKFTSGLYHFKDFKWNLFRAIPGNENERTTIMSKIDNNKNINSCYVISANKDLDGKLFTVSDAIDNVVGQEGTILIFGDAEIVYYEAEAMDGRFISI